MKNREAADASKILNNALAFVKARLLKRLSRDYQQFSGLAGGGGNASENSAIGKKNAARNRWMVMSLRCIGTLR